MSLCEYIWIDGSGNLRSKTKVIREKEVSSKLTLSDLPIWNYDGSSTGQATGDDSEVLIKPVYMCNDPFRGNGQLVLCETLNKDNTPHLTNTRRSYADLLINHSDLVPMFGFEQEFFVLKNGNVVNLKEGQNLNNLTKQGNYYCGVGGENICIREFAEKAMEMVLNAGLNITGMNAEVAPSQWEFQVCSTGVEAADELYMLRYILQRVAELYGYSINIQPKPLSGEWNGSGCHTNFSTSKMRADGGVEEIMRCINVLSTRHEHHMSHYGADNRQRMTGSCETASYDVFSHGYGDRTASIRIPNSVFLEGKGYLEDRRPGSNMDPYVVSKLLVESVI